MASVMDICIKSISLDVSGGFRGRDGEGEKERKRRGGTPPLRKFLDPPLDVECCSQ